MPVGLCDAWALRLVWYERLSDHAVLVARQARGRGLARQPCTPAALRTLPAQAWNDLRRTFTTLETVLQIPHPGMVDARRLVSPPPAPGGLEIEDPFREVAEE
eukprot:5478417-Lingulodinium_polyedra.AAC.1